MGGLGGKYENMISSVLDPTRGSYLDNFHQGRRSDNEATFTDLGAQLFSSPFTQQYSNTTPFYIPKNKEEALKSMVWQSHYQNTEALPDEVFGYNTGTYNPGIPGTYYQNEDGDNVWVANPEYNSDFATSARGDFSGGSGVTQGHYKNTWDFLSDKPLTYSLANFLETDFAKNPAYYLGPFVAEGAPLIAGIKYG